MYTESNKMTSGTMEEEKKEENQAAVPHPPVTKMMKKRKSLVRRLSLNKFRLGTSSDQESSRSTPDSADNNNLNSQSSQQESQNLSDNSVKSVRKSSVKNKIIIKSPATPMLESGKPSSLSSTGGHEKEKGVAVETTGEYCIDDPQQPQKPDKFDEKTVVKKTVTVLQQSELPSSVEIYSDNNKTQENQGNQDTVNGERLFKIIFFQ